MKKDWLASLLLDMGYMLKSRSDGFCDFYTTTGRDIIVMTDQSLMSVIEIKGLKSSLVPQDYDTMLGKIALNLNDFMRKTGYQLSFVYKRDNTSDKQLNYVSKAKKATAKKLSLDVEDLIDEDLLITKERVYDERLCLLVQTSQGAIDKSEKELEAITPREEAPHVFGKQNPFIYRDVMVQKHRTFLDTVILALEQAEFISFEVLNTVNALRLVKSYVNPDTPPNWTPSVVLEMDEFSEKDMEELAGYRLHLAEPLTTDRKDIGHLLPISLNEQIIDDTLMEVKSKYAPPQTIAYGNKIYSSVLVRELPNMPRGFDSFFGSLNAFLLETENDGHRLMPYIFCLTLGSNGSPKFMFKRSLGVFLKSIPSPHNEKIFNSLSYLQHLNDVDEVATVSVQMSFMTWADNTRAGETRLRIQKTKLISAIENWGGIKLDRNIGDNMMAWAENLPIRSRKIARCGIMPLIEALRFAPLSRPASAFKQPSLFYCTIDGKMAGKEIFSSSIGNHFHIIVGGSGRGKSVLANDLMLEHILAPNQSDIPLIHIIDNGESSRGLIESIRASLPAELQHSIAFKRLQNSTESAINPFDIHGFIPNPEEKQSIFDFLRTATGLDENTPKAVEALFYQLIEVVYNDLCTINQKQFATSINRELTELCFFLNIFSMNGIVGNGYTDNGTPVVYWDYGNISFFELSKVCQLRLNNSNNPREKALYARARDLAHRYAMPILGDFNKGLTSEQIINSFGDNKIENMGLIEYVQQAFSIIVNKYPMFTSYTNFDAQDSQILSVDLKEVLVQGDEKNNSLMLQVALMLGTKKFLMAEEHAEYISTEFRDEFIKKARNTFAQRKILFIDEFHAGARDAGFMEAVRYGGATWRKYNIGTFLASQYLNHYEHRNAKINLLTFCTHLFLLEKPVDDGVNNDLDLFIKQYKIPQKIVDSMDRMGLSDAYGSLFFNLIRTKNGDYYNFVARKLGPKRLWAVNSSPNERSLRNAVQRITKNYRKTINALAFYFGASLGTHIQDELKNIDNMDISDHNKKIRSQNLFETVANEVVQAYDNFLMMERQRLEAEAKARHAMQDGDYSESDMVDDDEIMAYLESQMQETNEFSSTPAE